MEMFGAEPQPAGERLIAVVGGFGDDAREFHALQSPPHRARNDLLDADFRAVQIRDRAAHRKDAPGIFGMIEKQIRQRGDGLHFQLVRPLAVGVGAEVGILQQAGDRTDERGVVGRSLDVFQVQGRGPTVGSPKIGKDGIAGVLQIARQNVNLRVGLGGFVILRHVRGGRKRLLGFHGRQKLAKDVGNGLWITGKKGFDDFLIALAVHADSSPSKSADEFVPRQDFSAVDSSLSDGVCGDIRASRRFCASVARSSKYPSTAAYSDSTTCEDRLSSFVFISPIAWRIPR